MTKPYDIANVSSDLVPTSLKVYYPSPVNRTIESKLGDMVSVKDFGAVGDGVADDTGQFLRKNLYLKKKQPL